MDLLTTYTHHSELQVITALSVISTLYKLLQHPLSLFQPAVFISRSLAKASNSGDSSASRAQVLSSQPPVQTSALNRQVTTIVQSLINFPCRAQLNCQHSTNWTAPVLFFITLFTDYIENTVLILLRTCSFSGKRFYRAVAQKRLFVYALIA
jgi:hypothetical protein